jgi:hypothetical protein
MNVQEVYEFMNKERLSIITDSGLPQPALMGMAVTPQLEVIFDTVRSSRKYPNLKKNPRVAWVVGCTTEVSVQYEGLAEELAGEELAKYKKIYLGAFTDGPVRGELAGHYLFCCATNVGQVLRLQSRTPED